MNVLRPTLLTLACLLAQPTMASDLPSLGDASSALVSPQQEYQLGRAWLSIVRGQVSQLSDPQLKDFVESSVYRLAETSQVQDRRLEFVLLNSPQINAFAAPGGIIGVNGGLFLYAQTEGEYASVLAHELAHLSQRHFARGLEAQQRMQLPVMPVSPPSPRPRRRPFRNSGASPGRTSRRLTVSVWSTWRKPATTPARCRACSNA